MQLTHVLSPPQTAPRTTFAVTLTDEEHRDLEQLPRTGQGKARTLTPARILLRADAGLTGPGWADAAIARVRRAFVEQGLKAARHRRPARTPGCARSMAAPWPR